MTITEVAWTNDERNQIRATIDGTVVFVPVDPLNRHYAAIIASGMTIAEPS